jgi:tetratricopeptide (TPR) repeat protein
MHQGKFATISAVAGLDFPDDARAPGIVDWDRDGDLDVWIANRTAPLVRYLRNDSPRGNRFLAIKLVGTLSNRDAIGARAEVMLAESSDGPLVKTLHAGEGFLGQSSKWIHFGLGPDAEIAVLRVRWPSGGTEEFTGAKADGWFVLEEGSGRAEPIERAAATVPLAPSRKETPPPTEARRIVFAADLPVPALRYEGFDRAELEIPHGDGQPVAINLWASWCGPCVEELTAWAAEGEALKNAGLKVFALSVDEVDDQDAGRAAAAEMVRRLELPFATGIATGSIYRRLEQVHHWPFQRKFPLPVPTTFLLDGEGHLAAIYHGPVAAEKLVEDARLLSANEALFRAAAIPFPGRWDTLPRPQRPIQTAIQLVDKGDVTDAAAFVRRHHELLAPHPEFGLLATWIGDEQVKAGRAAEALAFYEMAVERDPRKVTVLNNLAWQLAAHPDVRIRNPEAAIRWAEQAAEATGRKDALVLDTLAVAYASAGRFDEAQRTAESAEQMARREGNDDLAVAIADRIELFKSRRSYLDPPPSR